MPTPFLIKIIFFYSLAVLLAVVEIQIEGPNGWAKTLPTWRPAPNHWLARIVNKLFKKELTGYHLALNIFLLLFVHLPFIWNWHWSSLEELELLSFYFVFIAIWDFLWFVLNPHHSLNDFNRENVSWHKRWWGKFPADYYICCLIAIIVFIPLIMSNPAALTKLIILILGNLILTALTVLLYPKAY